MILTGIFEGGFWNILTAILFNLQTLSNCFCILVNSNYLSRFPLVGNVWEEVGHHSLLTKTYQHTQTPTDMHTHVLTYIHTYIYPEKEIHQLENENHSKYLKYMFVHGIHVHSMEFSLLNYFPGIHQISTTLGKIPETK